MGATGRQIHGSLHKDRQVTLLLMTSSSPDTFSSLIGDSFRGAYQAPIVTRKQVEIREKRKR